MPVPTGYTTENAEAEVPSLIRLPLPSHTNIWVLLNDLEVVIVAPVSIVRSYAPDPRLRFPLPRLRVPATEILPASFCTPPLTEIFP